MTSARCVTCAASAKTFIQRGTNMPELPEVETTRRALAPYLVGRAIERVAVREHRLRWPVPPDLPQQLGGRVIRGLGRRGKYLLVYTRGPTLIVHLGMSGSLRLVPPDRPPEKHDHIDLYLSSGRVLRYRDPRRFGVFLYTWNPPGTHPLLAELGPEPLDPDFAGEILWQRSRGRRVAIKSFLMDAHHVAGLGNIYTNEALFLAGIDPRRPAGRLSRPRYERLARAIQQVLQEAIEAGGTTLRDFLTGADEPGRFRLQLRVYQRAGEPCPRCGQPIRRARLGQRSTFFCPRCQK